MAKRSAKLEEVKKVPRQESPEEKFVRLAKYRMNAFIKRAHQIENLAGTNYQSTAEQRAKLIKKVDDIAASIIAKFERRVEKKQDEFEL